MFVYLVDVDDPDVFCGGRVSVEVEEYDVSGLCVFGFYELPKFSKVVESGGAVVKSMFSLDAVEEMRIPEAITDEDGTPGLIVDSVPFAVLGVVVVAFFVVSIDFLLCYGEDFVGCGQLRSSASSSLIPRRVSKAVRATAFAGVVIVCSILGWFRSRCRRCRFAVVVWVVASCSRHQVSTMGRAVVE